MGESNFHFTHRYKPLISTFFCSKSLYKYLFIIKILFFIDLYVKLDFKIQC